jgi:hypothetical protein
MTIKRIELMPTVDVFTYERKTVIINDIISSIYWISPILNPQCGKIEPPTAFKVDGVLAYANGTDWNPGGGKGFYYWNSSAWVKL